MAKSRRKASLTDENWVLNNYLALVKIRDDASVDPKDRVAAARLIWDTWKTCKYHDIVSVSSIPPSDTDNQDSHLARIRIHNAG